MNAFDRIMATRKTRGAGFWVLIDPDRTGPAEAAARAADAERAGADVILVGSSLLISDTFGDAVREIRSAVKLPVIIFPGSTAQISADADAILFLSLVSGRNPDLLIGQHVRAAPAIKAIGLEPIPTAYMLVESGTLTTIEYISDTKPIPRQKPDIAMAHALAAEYMGMKLVYLDGGSGAKEPVPTEMIRACYEYITLPLIVGGGIRSGDAARAAVHAGASFVVVGNALEKTSGRSLLTELADAVHSAAPA
ncbi:MAG TPA: geranylgeranylglyceryl/heptaprenylglyceryl phosphate synthase [Candidatus Latescibacteria bacterium]|nr:geranylgeranylglyceryl/heptaprenylglyceryl phosphate synthase [Candidatus Latescibacterota bacterium]